jgi:glycosyltransferase involved in cell wall biosynthesis
MTLVSVLMPMRNAEPFVKASVESVLAQQGVELEVVIIDDGSTDRSAAIVHGIGDARVRILPGPRSGIGAAFNAALAAARGDIITRCDADDLFTVDRLVWQVRWLDEHQDFGAVAGQFAMISPAGQPVAELGGETAGEITGELLQGQTRTHLGTFAIRANHLRQIRGCRLYFETAEDLDLQLRLGEVCRVWFEPRVFYRYRVHDASITHTQITGLRQFFEETARRLAEQRRATGTDDLERGCPPPVPVSVPGRADASGEWIQGVLLSQAWQQHSKGLKWQALRTAWRACAAWPRNLGAWKSLALLALKW